MYVRPSPSTIRTFKFSLQTNQPTAPSPFLKKIQVALNYYSQWLVNTCSTYPPKIWDELWGAYDRPVFRHTDNMGVTLFHLFKKLTENPLGARIFNPDFFELRENKAIGFPIRTVKPILNFPGGIVELGYNVGSRGNGVDEARWPKDLLTEIIKT